jgi:type I restriction enzyme, S subunit
MSRQTYPAYKRSGLDWVGDIPEHWDIRRMKYTASINDEALSETTNPEFEFTYVDIGSVDAVKGIVATEVYRFEDAPSRARRIVREGDTIVSTVRTYLRAIAAIRSPDDNLIVSTGFAVVRPRTIDPGYLSYALRSPFFIDTIVSRSTGVSYPAINAPEIGNIGVTIPPIKEQQAIAAFLDRETARIDAMIEKKQRQIELLQEKRSALISHAVTKGLDPNAKMKDSGIEWLGEIPAHWEVKRVKNLGTIRYGLGEPPEYVDEGLPFIRATDINRGKVNLDAVRKVRSEDVPWSRRPKLHLGEILVVRSGAYTGDSAIITEDAAGCIAGYDMVLTISKAYAPFVAWALLSKYMLHGQIYLERMRAAQPHLNAEELGGFVILMPPLAEQRQIAETLTSETDKLDALADKIRSSIEMLREHRTALISAAVTGRIDVRGKQHA